MRKRIVTGVVLLLIASPIALAVVSTVQAQRGTERLLPPTQAAASASGYQIVQISAIPIAPQQLVYRTVSCPQGKKVVGGGTSNGGNLLMQMHESFPVADGSGWSVSVFSGQTRTLSITIFAVCIVTT